VAALAKETRLFALLSQRFTERLQAQAGWVADNCRLPIVVY
jgi:hypothetical protein